MFNNHCAGRRRRSTRSPARTLHRRTRQTHQDTPLHKPAPNPLRTRILPLRWVVSRAPRALEAEGFPKTTTLHDLGLTLKNVPRLESHANTYSEDPESIQHRARSIASLVDEYSRPDNTRRLGAHLETPVRQRAQGFSIAGQHTVGHGGKRWSATNQPHTRRSGRAPIGRVNSHSASKSRTRSTSYSQTRWTPR